MVEQAARCCDEDIDAARQPLGLRTLADTAEHDSDGEAEMATISAEALRNLCGEFACRTEDQCSSAVTGCRFSVGCKPMKDRQRKGGRFAGAGGRLADQVAAFEQERDRFALDRGRFLITQRGERLEDFRAKTQVGEGSWGRRVGRGVAGRVAVQVGVQGAQDTRP